MAIQAHFGFSPFPGRRVVAMVDWTYDVWDFLPDNPTAGLLFFFGFGAKFEWFTGWYSVYGPGGTTLRSTASTSGSGCGARGPAGALPYRAVRPVLRNRPRGVLFVVPDTGVYYDVDAAFGFRYRF